MKLQITLTGPILAISGTQTIGNNGFKKRTFVVTNPDDKDSKYDSPIQFELHKDRCDLLDKFSVGETVEVTADVRGNEYNGRFFVNLIAWRVVHANADGAPRIAPDRGFSKPPERSLREVLAADDDIDF